MRVEIYREQPNTAAAAQLITELDAHLDPLYPSESRHGLSVERLLHEAVAFFMVQVDGQPAGCGGIKFFDYEYGEIKRMYVREAWRGKGLGMRLLDHLAAYARAHDVTLLRLETGIHQAAAVHLYERWGFVQIPPFGIYRPDPLSLFYEKRIV